MVLAEYSSTELPADNHVKSFLRDSILFQGFSDRELEDVIELGRMVSFNEGDIIITENEVTDQIFLLKEGEVGIYKWDDKSQQSLLIATLGPNEVVGELILLDNIPRSASVHARKYTELFEISINKLKDFPIKKNLASRMMTKLVEATKLAKQKISGKDEEEVDKTAAYESKLYSILIRNLAKSLSMRVRNANVAVAEALRNELEHARARVVMGMFIVAIVAMLSLYVMLLTYVQQYGKDLATPSFVTIPMIGIFAAIVFAYMRKTRYPLSVFGLTLKNWQISLKESLICTIAFMGLLVIFKWYLINFVEAFKGHSIIQGNVVDMNIAVQYQMVLLFLYLFFAPLQEFISRGALQSSFEEFLMTPHKKVWAILLSNLMFGMTHFIISPWFGMLSFVPGLMWGWLYSRHRTLVGVIVSHEIIGIWAIFILGL